MQKRPWRRFAAPTAEMLFLFAIAGLTLGALGPRALHAVVGQGPAARVAPAALAGARPTGPAAASGVLARWADTQSLTEAPFLISLTNNAQIRSLAATIPGLPAGSPQAFAAQQSLAALTGTEFTFESNYKLISNKLTAFQTANLISGFLHGELRAYNYLATAPTTTDAYTRAFLQQQARLLQQQVTVFDNAYRNATANKLTADQILTQLTVFARSFQVTTTAFVNFQVQELNSATISSTPFTFTPPAL